ncbi:glycosyltransferase family 2 protein [Sinorhizobium terangae]|uniref:glycosyltransferase family 2 protein n=1 Tax=Sinorhizobium terangae TaxID=110322 RepID=UPI0024B04912|nr:glycosyltransferase family 2 protein [Sinorhizobium terangae]WFU50077.1 glycosyltransferase family 2 protein [Sinorhizobium terangae]
MDKPQVDDRGHNSVVPGQNGTGSLAAVIVTYNSASVLPGLLDSLAAGFEGIANYEVIVVDNASRDGSADLANAHPIGAKVIRMGRNAGYAAGINAATATVAPWADLLILNPDVRLHPGAARQLVDRLAEASVGVVVPQILGEDGKIRHSLRREPSAVTVWSDALLGTKLAARIGLGEIVADPKLYQQGGRIEWATGAILAISARTRRIVGDWDESFFLYSEEVDYMKRVRRSALLILYDTNARAVHIGGAYHRNPYLSALMTANRVRYYRRHHGPVATMLFRLAIIVGESMRILLGPGHRAALRAALTPNEVT